MFGKSRVFAIVANGELVNGAKFVANAKFVDEAEFKKGYR